MWWMLICLWQLKNRITAVDTALNHLTLNLTVYHTCTQNKSSKHWKSQAIVLLVNQGQSFQHRTSRIIVWLIYLGQSFQHRTSRANLLSIHQSCVNHFSTEPRGLSCSGDCCVDQFCWWISRYGYSSLNRFSVWTLRVITCLDTVG
jgi:hypothetical protein